MNRTPSGSQLPAQIASPSYPHNLPQSTSHLDPDRQNSNDLKRRKLSPDLYQVSSSPSTSSSFTSSQSSTITTPALLYHFALSAHHASHQHLQQAFVHSSVNAYPQPGTPPVPLYTSLPYQPFVHDAQAAAKALGLQLMALDLLRAGLAFPNLSEKEKVAFSLEFGIIGLKVYLACRQSLTGKGKKVEKKPVVDASRLIDDIQDIVGQAYFVSQKQTSFVPMKLQLELLTARLAFVQGKYNLGKKMVQQALHNNRHQTSHRYALYLLYLEYIEPLGSMDVLNVTDELMTEAYAKKHIKVVQLAALTKARFVFVHRRWELAAQTLSALAAMVTPMSDPSQPPPIPGEGDDATWQASLNIHYVVLKALWEGRIGNDAAAKTCLRHVYSLMDQAMSSGTFNKLREQGGAIQVNVSGDTPLQIQMTPPNILYIITYLTTVVSRRDFAGSKQSCHNILHPTTFRQFESILRADDMWDGGFASVHDLSRCHAQQIEVMTIRGEMMIEHASALIFRSEFEAGYQLLLDVIDHLRTHNLFQAFAPHLCLLFAQHATLIGVDSIAANYYQACMRLINTGSEFGLIAEIGLMGSQGRLTKLSQNPAQRDIVNSLVERCKGSISAIMNGAGYLLASLTDENVVTSKNKLSTAYEISSKSNNNILRLLIFAFTTSTHHYGGRDRMYRQLETGKDLAKLLGGIDRPDGVGQVVLGLWFAYRLKEYYRQEGDQESADQARRSMQLHLDRLNGIKAQAAHLRVALGMK